LYWDRERDAETEYLRCIVEHNPPAIALNPAPVVCSPEGFMLNYRFEVDAFRNAPQPSEAAFDFRIAGFFPSGRYIAMTPNAGYIPCIADADDSTHRLRQRIDGCFGAEDMTRVPTYYLPGFAPHLACIPRKPLSRANPTRIMWENPEGWFEDVLGQLEGSTGQVILKESTALHLTQLVKPLRKKTNDYLAYCRANNLPPMAWARGLEMSLFHVVGRMTSIGMSTKRAFFMAREAQRLWLELKGMMTFVYEVQPILTGVADPPAVYSVRWVLGAVTTRPEDVALLHRAGVPVWYVLELTPTMCRQILSEEKRGVPHVRLLRSMRTPEQMAETGRHPDNLPYIFQGCPTDPYRLKQMHRYGTLRIAVNTPFADDLSVVDNRDPLAFHGAARPAYGVSVERPLEYLQPQAAYITADLDRAPPRESTDAVFSLPRMDVEDSDAGYLQDSLADVPFASPEPDGGSSLSSVRAAPALGYASTSGTAWASTSGTAGASTSGTALVSTSSTASTPSTAAPPPSPLSALPSRASDSGAPPTSAVGSTANAGQGHWGRTGERLYRGPVGVHRVRYAPQARHPEHDLPKPPIAWELEIDSIQPNWFTEQKQGDEHRAFPKPGLITGPKTNEKCARYLQAWIILEAGVLNNARRAPLDEDSFAGQGLASQPPPVAAPAAAPAADLTVAAAACPGCRCHPSRCCCHLSTQDWKDILNAHVNLRSQGGNVQRTMEHLRGLFGSDVDFAALEVRLQQPYTVCGELTLPGRLPSSWAMKGALWRLQELGFRKDLLDLDRRVRTIVITPAEEVWRFRNLFHPSTFDSVDVLAVRGYGLEHTGLVDRRWYERFDYVAALSYIMLDWDPPLPTKLRFWQTQGDITQKEAWWLETNIIRFYVRVMWHQFKRRAIPPPRRSWDTSEAGREQLEHARPA
ncbi:hypothetical protein BD626DRAFT_406111, partial [Schizophyllum amplum]